MILIGTAGRADAQDVRVQTRTPPDEVIREVMRIVNEAIGPELSRDISREVQSAIGHLPRIMTAVPHFVVPGAAQDRNFPIRVEDRETKTVRLGAAGALELRTVGGNITVSAGSGNDATVEIVRTSRGRTDADAKTGLERVKVEVDQQSERATVSVQYPSDIRPPYSVSVSYNVKAPAGTRLTISTLGGNITVSDIKGDMSTSTHGGNTTITNARGVTAKSLGGTMTFTGIDSDGTVQAETLGGNLDFRKVKARRVQASTVGGDVSATDVTCDNADLGTMGGNVTFSGALSRSGRYELHTNGGDVTFTPSSGAGYELQASTFAGDIRTEGVTMQIRGSVTGRGPNRSLRGTVGDGSALVILRTFSGTVTVKK
jgi:DUF4097 and DUF4098 domain-containing protein YvlB